MISYEAALITFLVSFLLSRLVMSRASKLLSVPQKGALVETFASLSRYTLLPGVVLIALYLIGSRGLEGGGRWLAIAFLVVLGGVTVGMQCWVYRRVRALGLPAGYLRRFLLSRVLLLLGMAMLMVSVASS